MPPSLNDSAVRASLQRARLPMIFVIGAALSGFALWGCQTTSPRMPTGVSDRVYPPAPQTARVIALGNLRGKKAATPAQVELSRFVFGVEPPPALTIANPTGVATSGDAILVCDAALDTLIRWDLTSGEFRASRDDSVFDNPFAVDVGPGGELLVCDYHGVRRFSQDGTPVATYRLEGAPFKPAGALIVGDAVWVSNDATNCIEVFALADGTHRKSIGKRGRGPGEFYLPRGMARTSDGNVCIVDLLNSRVQVLDAEGRWVRDIGGPGDSTGAFGRPKDVAVAPDGTVFVTDAFSQRVHAFDREGVPLLAFGEPDSGVGALTLPNGIAVTTSTPRTQFEPAAGHSVRYYILVAEQLDRPGVRVYGWLEPALGSSADDIVAAVADVEASSLWPAADPHWKPKACSTCHDMQAGRATPIPYDQVDALCVSCHDGIRAPADPHPIGRPVQTDLVKTPADWPNVNGMVGCATCHEFEQHCSGQPAPSISARLALRAYDPRRQLEYCGTCHTGDVGGGRFSPHRQRDSSGRVRDDACFFCHTVRPEIPADGRRRFDPKLRVATSELCRNCHRPHWDLSPRGHVDRPVTPEIRAWMLHSERGGQPAAAGSERDGPALLPLGQGAVTCYTCHNPHYDGLFPAGSELAARATNPSDRASRLRADWIDLCSQCHNR